MAGGVAVAAVAEAREDGQVVVVVQMALENLPVTCLAEDHDLDAVCVNFHVVVGHGVAHVQWVAFGDLLARIEMGNGHDVLVVECDLHAGVAMENEVGEQHLHPV